MIDDRIDDGKRIAQLLASELSGTDHGAMAHVTVENADRNADPSEAGTHAYDVAIDGTTAGRVTLYPTVATLTLADERAAEAAATAGLDYERRDAETVVHVTSGVDVKRAFDVVETLAQAVIGE